MVNSRNNERKSQSKPPTFAIFAIGGYGRKELAPQSDVDLMFLVRDRNNTAQVEDIYYRLLDQGIYISHCVRTIEECLEEGLKDLHTRTSLLDWRFIVGDTNFQSLFQNRVLTEILHKNPREFFAARLKEMMDRHKKFGTSVYLLEPNIKDSGGGLRDMHEALWLSKIALNFKSMTDFAKILPKNEYVKLNNAYDFLLKIRIALYISALSQESKAHSKHGQDILLFSNQQATATILGIGDTKYFTAAERLLRFYYIKAATIKGITEKIRNIAGSMFVRLPRSAKKVAIDSFFSLSQNKIMLNDDKTFKIYPHKIIEAYLLSAKTGKGFTRYLRSLIRKSLSLINKNVRNSKAAARALMEIFRCNMPYAPLSMLLHDGVLGRLIPEMAPLRLLVVHEPYHIYTVDAHTMLAIQKLQSLSTTTERYDKTVSLIYNNYKDKEILYMSVLFHDIGKSMGRWHSTEGYVKIKPILDRLRLNKAQRDTVEFLVKNHLLLSRAAFTMDIDDYDTIALIAEGIRDETLLNALLLVTYADMSAINPDFFTDWRKSLLLELYNRLLKYFRGVNQQTHKYIEAYINCDDRRLDIMSFIGSMPNRYIVTTAPNKIIEEFELLPELQSRGFAIKMAQKAGNTTELTILARDRQGLLTDIVGTLSSRALNILSLRTFVSSQGYVVDRLQVSNYQELWWQGMDELIETELRQVCTEKEDNRRKKSTVKRYPRRDSRISSFLDVDNGSSSQHTIFETISTDRIGLLYDITSVFSNNGLDIMMARVNTEMDIAHDVFYITGVDGAVDSENLQSLMGQIWDVLNY